MFLPQKNQVIRCVFCLISLGAVPCALAAPNDVFLHTQPNIGEPSFRSEVGYDLMNDTVDVFNLRTRQGPVSGNTGDYRGGHAVLGYNFSPIWSSEVTYWRRNIEYGSNTNAIDSWLLSLYYDPIAEPLAEDRAVLRFSLWGDHASDLSKTSPTKVNGTTFNQLSIQNPNDIQAQLDAIFSSKLNERNQFTGFVSAGVSRVNVGNINASLQRGNCTFNVDIDSNNLATGTLAAPCNVGGSQVLDASFSANSSQYGVDINKDMNYTATFLEVGGSWRWTYNRFTSNLGYQYQYIKRNGVDKQVSNFGGSPITSNHTLGLDVSYKLNKKVDVFVQGQAFKYNFVGTIPFLYNAVTASRLDRYYGVTSVGVRFAVF